MSAVQGYAAPLADHRHLFTAMRWQGHFNGFSHKVGKGGF